MTMNRYLCLQRNERALDASVSEFPSIEAALVRQTSCGSTATGASFTSSSSRAAGKRPLPSDFEWTPYTVLCGRGKECFDAVGNRRFRVLVHLHLSQYSAAETKAEKSRIVSGVVDTIRKSGGSFVKEEHGVWYEVGDAAAREKVGSQFRDCLHLRYKSASKCKSARRREQRRNEGSNASSLDQSRIFAARDAGDDNDDELCTLASESSVHPLCDWDCTPLRAAPSPPPQNPHSPSSLRRCSLFDGADDDLVPEDLVGTVSADIFAV